MSSKTFVICDSEHDYACNLADVIAERRELHLQVYVCTDEEQLSVLFEGHPIDYLLIEEEYFLALKEQPDAGHVFVLVKGDGNNLKNGETRIYKYQSASRILEQILETCMDRGERIFYAGIRGNASRLVGIFSPIHRCGKTAFALELGKAYGMKGRVLYLNFEMYAGSGNRFPKEEAKDLGDLLYYARQEQKNLALRINMMSGQMGELEYIAPMRMGSDLIEVTEEMWKGLLGQLLSMGQYDVILLDLSEAVQGLPAILDLCREVYVPYLDGNLEEEKLQQFADTLTVLGYENLRDRMQKISMQDGIVSAVAEVMRGGADR